MPKPMFALLSLVVPACAYTVTYTSDPAGALVAYRGGDSIGIAPVTVDYGYDPDYIEPDGCLAVRGVTATWASGARHGTGEWIRLCRGAVDYRVRLARSADAPGLETDIRVARAIEEAAARRAERRKAAEDEALDELIETILAIRTLQAAERP